MFVINSVGTKVEEHTIEIIIRIVLYVVILVHVVLWSSDETYCEMGTIIEL